MEVIAWWGAILSTLLALMKLWEFWRDRFRIEVDRTLTTDPEIGNKIFVRNLAGHPVILSYWELISCEGRWSFQRHSTLSSPEADARDSRIETHSSFTLTFAEQDHFDWGSKALKGRRIYIRLYIAGRRPIFRKVCG